MPTSGIEFADKQLATESSKDVGTRMNTDYRDTIYKEHQQKIANYFENKEDIIGVYLFGSHASGKVRSSSDVDLAILFDSRDRTIISRRLDKYLIDLSRILRKDTHLTTMNFASEELLKQIFKKGKCIIVNDSKTLARFKMTAYSRIVNFHYYRGQFQAGMVRKVMEGI